MNADMNFSRGPKRRWSLILPLLIGAAAGAAIPCAAQSQCDYTVSTLADSGTGSLRAAIPFLAASGGSTICFSVTGTITLASTLNITLPVTITDPGGAGITISGNNAVQILSFNLSSATDSARINGLTLTGGNALYGGAIENVNGTLTLVGTKIDRNTATEGGGIYNEGGTITCSQCVITNNTAQPSGDYGGGYGGGILNSEELTLNLQDSVFGDNLSTNSGGGVYNQGSLVITGGSFVDNSSSYGGAIDIEYYGTISDTQGTVFDGNAVTQDGGAIWSDATQGTIEGALFTNNWTTGVAGESTPCGGAICSGGTLTISESTFTGNSAPGGSGGAIENQFGSLNLYNVTIYGNSAAVLGSGVYSDNGESSGPNIANSIVSGNTATGSSDATDCDGCIAANDNADLIGVTVDLGPLAVNGGPTQTMMPLPGGPAIGAGNTQYVIDDTDQRGFSRLNSNQGVDIGAVQTHYSSVSYAVQPSNEYVSTTIAPAVSVQVVEVDGSTTNYPLGVPVTVSLQTTQGQQVSGALTGTLMQYPTTTQGVTAALFPDLAVNTAGTYELFATTAIPGNSSSADPAYSTTSNSFVISVPQVVTLAWNPAPLVYGPMPQSELNATATINGVASTGSFVYTFTGTSNTINVGQIYPVATYPVTVTYTPTGSTNQYTLSTSLQISQATPTLTWATPAAIYTSTPLSATQLDASATGVTGAALAGAFVYTPTAGATLTAGSQTLSTTFTPSDTTDYTTATAQVTIQVNAVTASSVALQESAQAITFGQSATFTATVTGSDGKPFAGGGTATFSYGGTTIGAVTVVNGTAAITTSTLTGGSDQIAVSYTNATLAQPLTSSVNITVNKATPTITWATPAAIYTSTPLSATQLDATATGVTGAALAGAFVYNPAAGTTLPAGSQTLSTTFTPTDTTDYATATMQVTIQVNTPGAASIALQESAQSITFGQSATFTVTVTGSDGKPFSGGTATFTSDGTAIGAATVTNGSAAVTTNALTGGTHLIGVSYTNSTLAQPLTASIGITVTKATPTLAWATPAAIYTSTPLSATQLDATATGVTGAALTGAFVYNPAAGTTLPAGSQTLSTTFTPTDTADYATATKQVTIQVNNPTAASVAIQESAQSITFGQSATFTATVTGSDGKPFSGGTATFTSDGTAIGAATVVSGSAAITATSLTGGTHQIAVSYTNSTLPQPLTASIGITVTKATPTLAWPTPTAIYTSTPLSATQLDATATGVTGAALAGAFVYNPAAGATLPAGSQTLSTTFTPTDTTDYATATKQVTIQVNTPGAASIVLQASAQSITFGQSATFTVTVTGSDGKPFSGGTAAFTSDGTAIGSATVANGSAAVTTSTLTGGTHQIAVSYTNSTLAQPLTASIGITVTKATPTITWATPAAIYTSTPLSATQLDATATGVTGAALAGAFVYNPAAGATLPAGSQTLSTTFTPTDTTDYATATKQVTIQVNTATAASVALQESAQSITFGQSITFTATVTGSDGKPYSGGTAAFTSDGTAIGSATVANGSAAISVTTLSAGTHVIEVSYTSTPSSEPLTSTTNLTVNKAAPVLNWATPSSITTLTPLSATQLDATATGVTRAALPGTFVYTPAAGTFLTSGQHVLSTTFTPTDAVDYTTATAQVTIQVSSSPITITSVSPSTTPLSSSPLSIVVNGTGFTSTSVVQVNGTAIATTVTSETALGATIPASDLATAGTLNLTVFDTSSQLTSNVFALTVSAPAASATITIEPATTSGAQSPITITLSSPYPLDLVGTLTLTFAPSGANGVDDPAVQLSTGGRTLTFTIPAGSTKGPQVSLQTGTVAGTITVTLTLTAGGVNVTPADLVPVTLDIAEAAPTITSVTFTNDSTGLITVVISGFSNTRDMTQASFVFTGSGASSLGTSSTVEVPATGLFSPWYSSTASDQYGSEFTYTQNFQLSRPDPNITGVTVTLTNSVGTSASVNSQ